MIFFFKSDGTLIKSAPETVYQGSAEAGKVYVVAPLNANMLVDVYYELPNGERWGAYLLENNGTVINNEELPDGWALWSTTLESAITQYAGTLKAQFGFYQSGTADKVPLITSQGVTIKIAKGVVRDVFPDSPSPQVYEYITNAVSTILQNFNNLPNEYLGNTQEDKIALKNNGAIEYSENATAGTIAKRDSDGKINVADGTEDLNAVNVGQFNAALANKVDSSSVSATDVKNTIAQRTATGQLKAADGVAENDLATVKQLNAVQGNYTDITNIDLNTGDTTVEYDTELGITVNAKGTITHKNGATEQPTTKFELPIVAGDGVSIDKKENEEKVEIKIATTITDELNKKVNTTDNFVKVFTIPNGASSGTLTADVKQKLCNPDGHNYYVYDDTSEMILKYSFNADDEIIQYKAIYLQTDKAYEITMQILPSNGSWMRSQTVLNGATANPTLTGTEAELKGLKVGGTDYKIPANEGLNTLTYVNLTFSSTVVQYDTTNGIQLNSIARFTGAAGNHDATMDIDLPIVGKDGIVIDKAADSEKIEISGENFVQKGKDTTSWVWGSVYGYNGNGAGKPIVEKEFKVSGGTERNSLALRTATGQLKVNDPRELNDAATKKYVDDNAVLRQLEDLTDTSADAFKTLKSGLYKITSKATSGFTNNLEEGYYTVVVNNFNESECTIFVQTVNKPDCYFANIGFLSGANGFYKIATTDNVDSSRKLYQHTYTFEAGTNNYVYCTTYKNSNTPMTAAEVINFFKSDPSVGKVVNVCVVNNGTTVGSGYFFDAGEGIDYTVIVLNSSADFIINADTNMTPNIIEL